MAAYITHKPSPCGGHFELPAFSTANSESGDNKKAAYYAQIRVSCGGHSSLPASGSANAESGDNKRAAFQFTHLLNTHIRAAATGFPRRRYGEARKRRGRKATLYKLRPRPAGGHTRSRRKGKALFTMKQNPFFCCSPCCSSSYRRRPYRRRRTSFTVSYGKGYYFVNPLTGAEATGIFTGKIPASVTVKAGGSVTVAENTIVFRDYEFVAWEHKYTVVEKRRGKTVTKRYSPATRSRTSRRTVTCRRCWKRPAELPLQIGGFLY